MRNNSGYTSSKTSSQVMTRSRAGIAEAKQLSSDNLDKETCVLRRRSQRSSPPRTGYLAAVRRSSRIAFVILWVVYATVVVVAWRKVLAVPDGRGDINGLAVATVAGALGLALLRAWLQEHKRGR